MTKHCDYCGSWVNADKNGLCPNCSAPIKDNDLLQLLQRELFVQKLRLTNATVMEALSGDNLSLGRG